MFGIKWKVLKRSGTLYDLIGSHSAPASNQSLNGGHLVHDPHRGHYGSILKGSHIRYQTEVFEEVWNIVRLKWISFITSHHPALKWGQKGQSVNIATSRIKSEVLIRLSENMTLLLF